MKTILIIGDDKLGHRAAQKLLGKVRIYLNSSTSFKLICKLVLKNSLRMDDLLQMAWADYTRSETSIPTLPRLQTNDDVINMINLEKPDRVICFRSGLIMGKQALSMGPQFLNLHYAELPEWGGLAALPRALRAKAYEQHACLHKMVSKIDGGEVYARVPYTLEPRQSYRENEDHAFDVGLILLNKIISGEVKV